MLVFSLGLAVLVGLVDPLGIGEVFIVLDGVDGLLTSMNAAFYTFMKYAKLYEMNKGRKKH
jgi:hypothetical protein